MLNPEHLSITHLKQHETEHRIKPHHALKANLVARIIIAKMHEIYRNRQQISLTPISPHVRLEVRSNRIDQPAITQ